MKHLAIFISLILSGSLCASHENMLSVRVVSDESTLTFDLVRAVGENFKLIKKANHQPVDSKNVMIPRSVAERLLQHNFLKSKPRSNNVKTCFFQNATLINEPFHGELTICQPMKDQNFRDFFEEILLVFDAANISK